jgi:hypothetical protein
MHALIVTREQVAELVGEGEMLPGRCGGCPQNDQLRVVRGGCQAVEAGAELYHRDVDPEGLPDAIGQCAVRDHE